MATKIGATVGVDGAKAFTQSIKEMDAAAKTLSAEMNAVTSAFIGNEKSMESLRAQNDILASKTELLNNKIDAQKARLKELDDQGIDPTSVQYQKLLKDLYNTEAQLNKTEAEIKSNNSAMAALEKGTDDAGDAMKETGKEVKQTGKEMDDAGDSGIKFGDILKANLASEAIIGGIKALGNALKGVASSLKDAVVDAANAADEINTLAKTTGLSTDEIQKFQYASDIIDVSLETLTGSMTKLTANMASAKDGSGAAAEAFQALGISVTDSSGELRDRQDVFNETIEALGKIENETERDALAMQVFGKSAQQLNPLIKGGAKQLEALGKEAEEAGLILDKEALDSLNDVSDGMARLQNSTEKTKQMLVASFAGPVSEGLDTVTGYVQELSKAFAEGDWEGFGDTVSNVVTEALDFLTSKLPEVGDFALKVVTKLTETLLDNAPKIINTGADLLLKLFDRLPSVISELTGKIPQLITGLIEPPNGLLSKIPQFVTAGVKLLSSLVDNAGEIVINLCKQLPQLLTDFISGPDGLLSHIPDIVQAGVDLVSTLLNNGSEIVLNLVQALPQMITGLISGPNGILSHIPEIISAGVSLLTQLVSNVTDIVIGLVGALPDIISGLLSTDGGLLDPKNLRKVFEAGVELFKGLFKDIPAMIKELAKKIKEFIEELIEKLVEFADYFIDVGKKYAKQLIQGFKDMIGISGVDKIISEKFGVELPSSALGPASDPTDSRISGLVNGIAGSLGNTAISSVGKVETSIYVDGDKVAQILTPALESSSAAAGTPFWNF